MDVDCARSLCILIFIKYSFVSVSSERKMPSAVFLYHFVIYFVYAFRFGFMSSIQNILYYS